MKLKDLKEFTIFYIYEHDNLTKDEKLKLSTFVKEADENKLVNLLVTGYMLKESYDFPAIGGRGWKTSFVNNDDVIRFIQDKVGAAAQKSFERGLEVGKKAGKITGAGQAVAITLVVAAAAYGAYQLYKNYLSKAAKYCRDFSGVKKTDCMAKYKKEAYRKRIQALTVSKKQCAKTKDPQKCAAKLDKKIRKLKAKFGDL